MLWRFDHRFFGKQTDGHKSKFKCCQLIFWVFGFSWEAKLKVFSPVPTLRKCQRHSFKCGIFCPLCVTFDLCLPGLTILFSAPSLAFVIIRGRGRLVRRMSHDLKLRQNWAASSICTRSRSRVDVESISTLRWFKVNVPCSYAESHRRHFSLILYQPLLHAGPIIGFPPPAQLYSGRTKHIIIRCDCTRKVLPRLQNTSEGNFTFEQPSSYVDGCRTVVLKRAPNLSFRSLDSDDNVKDLLTLPYANIFIFTICCRVGQCSCRRSAVCSRGVPGKV